MSNPLFDIRILSNNEVEIAKYKGNGGDVVIPEEIDEIFEIEHIYAKNRYDKEKTSAVLEHLCLPPAVRAEQVSLEQYLQLFFLLNG